MSTIWKPLAIGMLWNLSRRVISIKKLPCFSLRFYRHLGNYHEFSIMILGNWLLRKKYWGDQKKSGLSREPLIEYPKRHASLPRAFAWFDMDGKRCRSSNLPTIKESFTYKKILANGFRFQYPSMVLILDHYPVAIDPSVWPFLKKWHLHAYNWGFYYFIDKMGKLKPIYGIYLGILSKLPSEQFSPAWLHALMF